MEAEVDINTCCDVRESLISLECKITVLFHYLINNSFSLAKNTLPLHDEETI